MNNLYKDKYLIDESGIRFIEQVERSEVDAVTGETITYVINEVVGGLPIESFEQTLAHGINLEMMGIKSTDLKLYDEGGLIYELILMEQESKRK